MNFNYKIILFIIMLIISSISYNNCYEILYLYSYSKTNQLKLINITKIKKNFTRTYELIL